MNVILHGADGRYGQMYLKKFYEGKYGVKLVGLVDPKYSKCVSKSYNGIPTYCSLEEVPAEHLRNCINELALIPQIIPEIFKKLTKLGVKTFILPKPVVTNEEAYEEIEELVKEDKIKALVASNWHYSNITKMVKALLFKLTDKNLDSFQDLPKDFLKKIDSFSGGFKIINVSVEYNKKNEVLTIDPPLQELPHAAQIVYSTGLTDLEKIKFVMEKYLQSKSRVNVKLQNVEDIEKNIKLNSDLQMKDKLQKQRERLLEIYLTDGEDILKITADYDAKFNDKGSCEKLPSIQIESLNSSDKYWKYEIYEDNMDAMYKQMFDYIQGKENNSLTVTKYHPIAKFLCNIEKKWKAYTSANE